MVRGCLEWQRRGLAPPDVVKAATEEYRAESDPVAAFLQERCLIGPGYLVRAGALYKAYQEWSEEAGLKERERLSNTKFGRIMGSRFLKRVQGSGNFYQGVGLKAGVGEAGAPGREVEGMEGFVSSDPPFPSSFHTQQHSRVNWENPPQPSIVSGPVSDNPPLDPPQPSINPPRCVHCNRSMSPAAISELCGWCQARGAADDHGGEG